MKLDTRTLRAVGEDLQRIQLFDFDLELDGKKCLVRGTVAPPEMPEQSVERSSWEGLSGLWKQFRSPETDVRRVPARMPVERVYLQEDVDRLDAEGRSRRRDSHKGVRTCTRPRKSCGLRLPTLKARGDNWFACPRLEANSSLTIRPDRKLDRSRYALSRRCTTLPFKCI